MTKGQEAYNTSIAQRNKAWIDKNAETINRLSKEDGLVGPGKDRNGLDNTYGLLTSILFRSAPEDHFKGFDCTKSEMIERLKKRLGYNS